jgi:hypothetical protein
MQNKFVRTATGAPATIHKIVPAPTSVADPHVSTDRVVVFVCSSRQAEAENPLRLIENSKVKTAK